VSPPPVAGPVRGLITVQAASNWKLRIVPLSSVLESVPFDTSKILTIERQGRSCQIGTGHAKFESEDIVASVHDE